MRSCLIAILSAAFATAAAAAEQPAALVTEVSGNTDPPLSEMSELPPGDAVKVNAGGRLTFLHYKRCRMVTVLEGTLTIGPADYQTNGRIESDTSAPCPEVREVAASGNSAGSLSRRGVPLGLRLPPEPRIALTGPAAGKVQKIAVYGEQRDSPLLFELSLTGRRATLPSAATLPPNSRYRLSLTISGRSEPTEIPFITTAPPTPTPLVVLRID